MPKRLNQVTILFLCWGYSIHAWRRIKIFCDDSRFKVVVVSPYNYHFENAVNVHLGGEGRYDHLNGFIGLWNWVRLLKAAIPAYITLQKVYRQYRPDVIFLHTLMYPCYLAYALPKRTPRIITFWNGDLLWWAQWNGLERWFKKWLVAHGVRSAAAITVNSTSALETCTSYGIKKQNVHLIRYPGVDLSFFKPMDKQIARHKLGIKHEHVLLWPRGLGGYLNSDVLVDAAPVILKQYPNTLFVILSKVGRELVNQYQQHLKDLNIEKNFRFDLQVEHADMPQYYAASDAVLSISSHDSLPNVLLESYACSRPVIVGELPQLAEWINNGLYATVVPPRDHQALAQACKSALDPKNADRNRQQTARAHAKVEQDANSAVTVPQIKQIVLSVAGHTIENEDIQ